MEFTDALGNTLVMDQHPQRIVSLVPSLTELLYYLGLKNQIVGITRFCVLPKEAMKEATLVGGTKDLKLDVIGKIKPDLVVANKEENTRDHVRKLQEQYPVWVSDVKSVEDALITIIGIGNLTGTVSKALRLVTEIQHNLSILHTEKKLKAAYLIWKNPYMAAAGDTFIHSMMVKAGFENLFGDYKRYPEVSMNEIRKADIILLSSEPYPFSEKDKNEIQMFLPGKMIFLVDGKMFSWYGNRMYHAGDYFRAMRRMIE